MKKVVRSIPIGDHAHRITRHRVTLEDMPSSGQEIRIRQVAFLQELVVDGVFTGLMNCGPIPFETMKMWHTGECWQIDMEAVEQ